MTPSINLAAGAKTAQAEEFMEAAIQESLRVLREEFCAELRKVEDATQQLSLRADAHESQFDEVSRFAAKVTQHIEALKAPTLSGNITSMSMVTQVQAIEAEHKQIRDTIDMLTEYCNEHFEQVQSDLKSVASCSEQFALVTHDNITRIKEQVLLKKSGMDVVVVNAPADYVQDAQSTYATNATRDHLDDQISELRAQMSRIKSECKTVAIRHDKQIYNVHERISDLHMTVSQMKGEKETMHLFKIGDESVSDQLSEMRGAIEEVREKLSEHGVHPSHEERLKALMERTNERVLQMKKEMQDMQTRSLDSKISSETITCSDLEAPRHETGDDADQNTSEVQSSLSQIKIIAEALLLEIARRKEDTKDHVDKQISALQARLSMFVREDSGSHEANMDSPEDCVCSRDV